jgi:hypothetical protein
VRRSGVDWLEEQEDDEEDDEVVVDECDAGGRIADISCRSGSAFSLIISCCTGGQLKNRRDSSITRDDFTSLWTADFAAVTIWESTAGFCNINVRLETSAMASEISIWMEGETLSGRSKGRSRCSKGSRCALLLLLLLPIRLRYRTAAVATTFSHSKLSLSQLLAPQPAAANLNMFVRSSSAPSSLQNVQWSSKGWSTASA